MRLARHWLTGPRRVRLSWGRETVNRWLQLDMYFRSLHLVLWRP